MRESQKDQVSAKQVCIIYTWVKVQTEASCQNLFQVQEEGTTCWVSWTFENIAFIIFIMYMYVWGAYL